MEDATRTRVTRLLAELQAGDDTALDELFSFLYEELHEVAHRQRRRWRGDHTLQTTALVHEAYLKLVGQAQVRAESRSHLLSVAARAMRHILCNYARDRSARKRGGDVEHIRLGMASADPARVAFTPEQSDTLVALDEALRRLERANARQGKVVECRFFGGLTIEETAMALGVSPRTVKRDWTVAQAWLHREMQGFA